MGPSQLSCGSVKLFQFYSHPLGISMIWKPNKVSHQRTTHVSRICITTLQGTQVMLSLKSHISSKAPFKNIEINVILVESTEED